MNKLQNDHNVLHIDIKDIKLPNDSCYRVGTEIITLRWYLEKADEYVQKLMSDEIEQSFQCILSEKAESQEHIDDVVETFTETLLNVAKPEFW